MAEGLYALFGEEDPSVPFFEQLDAATRTYWSQFIEARCELIAETIRRLDRLIQPNADNGRLPSALKSLAAAQDQLGRIAPDLCLNFLDAWRDDLNDWQGFSSNVTNVGSTREAMDFLELKTWTLAEFGAVVVDSETTTGRFRVL